MCEGLEEGNSKLDVGHMSARMIDGVWQVAERGQERKELMTMHLESYVRLAPL